MSQGYVNGGAGISTVKVPEHSSSELKGVWTAAATCCVIYTSI